MDIIMQRTWDPAFQGNGGRRSIPSRFVSEYRHVIPHLPELCLPELTAEEVWKAFRCARPTAPGCDAWAPAELKCTPKEAAQALHPILQHAAETGIWPRPTRVGKRVYIAETAPPSLDAAEHRGLLILSAIYRTWGTLRLRQVQPWVAQWQVDQLHAGIKGRGAERAWMGEPIA
eukprot:5269918-Alexandrium_andersonii.AAC.1